MLTLDANVWIAAYDIRDRFYQESTAFLAVLAKRQSVLYGPAFVTVEVACAVARRTQNVQAGQEAIRRLNRYPLLTLLPLNERLITTAGELGVRHMLRGADALYAATAMLMQTVLVSWDSELVSRAGAVTPTDWLATNAR